MKLYNWQFAPNCRRVRMFIIEKGIELPLISEVIDDGMKLNNKFIGSWPHAMVPLLEFDDGTRFSEALGICRYFEDLNPEPNLLGATPVERAMITMWERRAYDESIIGSAEILRNALPIFHDRGLPGTTEVVKQIPDLVERGRGRVSRFYKKFEDQLRENEWVAGNRFTFADITTLCGVDFAIYMDMPIPENAPSVKRWYEAINKRPSAAASM